MIKHPEEDLGLVVRPKDLNKQSDYDNLSRQCCRIQAQFPVHIGLVVAFVFN